MYANLLLGVARRPRVRSMVTQSRLNRRVVSRFVPGESVEAAVAAVRRLDSDGMHVSLDYLGEDITEEAQADDTVRAYEELVAALAANGLTQRAEISVKLSALGQSLGHDGPARSTDRAMRLVAEAAGHGVDVTFDMEDHTTIDATLDSVRQLRAEYPRVGCVLQSMLHRTEGDARDLGYPGSRVRLVKGAYAEPASVAFVRKSEVDESYVRSLRMLVEGGAYPMVGTHDTTLMNMAEQMLDVRAAALVGSGSSGATAEQQDPGGELQMLYGIRVPEQQKRAAAGRTVRVYIPFGTDWYGYFSRRLAERPANLAFFARSLISH